MKSVMEFKDISRHPDAATRADQLPEFQQELERMGFRHLGYLEERISKAGVPGPVVTFQTQRDTDFITQALANGHVTEVMTAPGEIASVELERFFESQLLTFRTVFENGVVIETGIHPVRLPQRRDIIQPLRDVLEAKPLQKFLNWVMGGPHWGVHHRPLAGYLCEFMDHPAPRKIWMRHKRRVEELAQNRQTRIPPQNDMRLMFAMFLRRQQINQFQERLATWGQTALFGLFFLVLIAFFALIGGKALKFGFELSHEVVIALGLSTFFLALMGLAWPLRIAAGIAHYLPWPRIQPLKKLLLALPVNGNSSEISLQRGFDSGLAEEIPGFYVLQNIDQLKFVLSKDDQSLLGQWLKRRKRKRMRHQPDPQKALRLHQRYERLLLAELKLHDLPQGPKEEMSKFVFKMIAGMTLGMLLGSTLHQVNQPTSWHGSSGIVFMIATLIGMVFVDELFGFLFGVTFYASFAFNEYGLWIGLGLGVIYALVWRFFLQKRKFKRALKAVKEQYDLSN